MLKRESTGAFWNLIFNLALELVDKPDDDRSLVWYMSVNKLLTLYMEKGKICLYLSV